MTRAEIDANYAQVARGAVQEAREQLGRCDPVSDEAERIRTDLAWFSRSEAEYEDADES